MMGDPHCLFSSAWGSRSSSLLPSCCVFDSESTHRGHLHLSPSVHVRCCLFVFIFVHQCCQSSQGGSGKFSFVMDCQGTGELAGGYLLGYFPLSSWVHPSIRVIVIGSLSLSNSYHGCQIHTTVVKSALWLLWSNPHSHCDIPTCGIVELILWLLNPGCCYRICVIRLLLLNTWCCH